MRTIIFLSVLVIVYGSTKIIFSGVNPSKYSCDCNTIQAQQTIADKYFNYIPEYDSAEYSDSSFYLLNTEENRRLWYRDVESPDITRFTKLWNDYAPYNYHANHEDFVAFYGKRPNIELAFQLGPQGFMWAYHIFVIKKLDCCYLITRSYFAHARFTNKRYAILDQNQVDSLFNILKRINKISIDVKPPYAYCGYFADNRNNTKFYINFDKVTQENSDEPKKYVDALYDFFDNGIKWKQASGH